MGKDQQPIASTSKTEKARQFRFSRAGKAFLKDYFQNTSKAPKQKERQRILAHLKELGDIEATDRRISNWFISHRQAERKHPPLPPSTFALEPNEKKWVDARHKSLWPSLTKETLDDLRSLYAEHIAQNDATDVPHDLWAEGLDAKPAHVRMWCKFKARESTHKPQPDAAPTAKTLSQMAEEHSQLPTPGHSTSPEPPSTFVASPPLSPDSVKYEPPASPVVATTRVLPQPNGPKEKSSMGLHEAIESAFSVPLHSPAPFIQPPEPASPAARINQQQKPSPSDSHRTTDVVPPPMPPSISVNTATALTPAFLPPVSIASPPLKPEPTSPLQDRELSVPPLSEEPIPGPSTQPERDIALERAQLVTGVSTKLDELTVIFSSTYGLSQLAGSIRGISRRNQQFLNDVALGRFEHLRLTGAHLPSHQMASPMPEFNPLKVLAGWRESKQKGKERAMEDEMEVD